MIPFIQQRAVLFTILLVSVIFAYPMLSRGFFTSHDSITHTARTASYERAFLDGQLPPRWSQQANYGFGSPFMIFYYPLASYLMVPLHQAGLSFEDTYVVFNVLLFFLTPVGFYLWMKQLFPKTVALASSISYTALPYHFLLVYVRGAPGETLAFALLPFLFYCIEKLRSKFRLPLFLLFSLLYALLVLSHNGISLIFTPVLLVYALLRSRVALLSSLASVAFGLFLSAYFWFPALIEAKYTNFLYYFGGMYKDHFIQPLTAIYSPWGFGPDVNQLGGLSPQVGIPAFLVFLIAIFMAIRTKAKRKELRETRVLLRFWLLLFLAGIFLSTAYSSFLWERFDILKRFQFPWRFMAFSAFASAALFAYVFSKIKSQRIVYVFVALLILISLPFVRVKEHTRLGDAYYYAYPGSTYYHNEATTIWSAGDPAKKAASQVTIFEGEGEIASLLKKSNVHTFAVKADSDIKIVDNTILFPGWLVWVDGQQVPIEFQDPKYRGLITFAVPKGLHDVQVRFIETRERKVGDLFSLAGFGLFCILALVALANSLRSKKLLRRLLR